MLWNGNEYRKKNKVMGLSRQPSSVQIITDGKELENAEYFNHMGSVITNDAR
jgi:hypothetical protein